MFDLVRDGFLRAPADPGRLPPVLAAATFGIAVAAGDIAEIAAAYNAVAAIYLGVGRYMIFFLEPLPSADFFVQVNGGDGFAFAAIERDASYVTVQATQGGVAADPAAKFDMQVFRIP